jgi:hypothetical protein
LPLGACETDVTNLSVEQTRNHERNLVEGDSEMSVVFRAGRF